MNTVFEYKDYIGSAEVDIAGNVLFGKLLYIRDTISYEATTIEGLRRAFEEAVDDYLSACAEQGEEPDQPLKGSFNVRVGMERHRKIALAARREGVGLNDFICTALDKALTTSQQVPITRNTQLAEMIAATRQQAELLQQASLRLMYSMLTETRSTAGPSQPIVSTTTPSTIQ